MGSPRRKQPFTLSKEKELRGPSIPVAGFFRCCLHCFQMGISALIDNLLDNFSLQVCLKNKNKNRIT